MALEAPPMGFDDEHHPGDASDQPAPWLTSTKAHRRIGILDRHVEVRLVVFVHRPGRR
jgi:hypothetical protein